MREKIFPISKAAGYLGVTALTLRNWQNKGLIGSFRTPGGHRRFKKRELDRIKGINVTGDKLGETIKKLEEFELKNHRQQTLDKIITDLKDISEIL